MTDETPEPETTDPDECTDPVHAKLGFVTHALARVLGISPTLIVGSCENDGEVTLPLSAAEVLLWRIDWLTVAAHGVGHVHNGVTMMYVSPPRAAGEDDAKPASPPPDGPWPPDGTAPLRGPFFP